MELLLAIDLDGADETFARARGWADALGGRLHVLHVVRPPELPGASAALQATLDAGARRLEDDVRARLGALLATVPAARRGDVFVARGRKAPDEIVRYAVGQDVLLVGTHGRHGLERLWLGSVAERVVRESPVPVLVLRDGPPAGRGVLAAVDVVEGPGLVGDAASFAACLGERVDALHVVPPPVLVDGGYGVDLALAWTQAREAVRDRLAELLEAQPEDARGEVAVEQGEPARVVAERSRRYGLVVVRTHQRQGVARFWLGSVAEAVVRRAETSVLVLPPPAP